MSVREISTNKTSIDSRYEYLIALRDAGRSLPKYAIANEGYVPISAKVTDLNNWKNVTYGQPGTEIFGDQNWIVTARVLLIHLQVLRELPFVKSLKTASPIRPFLKETVSNIGLASNPNIPASILVQGGQHVVVGIIDVDGCDFAHRNFIKTSNKTRIHSIWAQAEKSMPNSPYGYGRLYTRDEINNALSSPDPYATLGYSPRGNSHGTHVMDIATGNGPSPGIAPQSKIMFVDLALELDEKLTDSACLLEAVEYIFKQAGDHPCAINISLGQYGGPHDGSSHTEQGFDRLLKEKPNRAIVVCAGNSYWKKSHYSGAVENGGFVDIKWEVDFDFLKNELEVWYSGKDEFEIEIFHEDKSEARFPLDTKDWILVNKNGKNIRAFATHIISDPDNGDNVFKMYQESTQDGGHEGIWTLRLHGKSILDHGKFHVWSERVCDDEDNILPSSFIIDDSRYTLNSIATGHKTIVVGSYDAYKTSKPISYFSSEGPTRDGRFKPEVSAPGHDVWAAKSTSQNELVRMSGTSMATPAVTGLVARILGRAYELNLVLNVDQIRNILISTCLKNPPLSQGWDSRYGYGRISSDALLAVTKQIPSSFSSQPIGKSIPLPKLPPLSPAASVKQAFPKSFLPAPSFTQVPPTIHRPKNIPNLKSLTNKICSPQKNTARENFNIGICYYFGIGNVRNYTEAARWFRVAADKGNSEAQYCLGICYIYGQGVPVDRGEALKWVQKAASTYPLAELVKRQLEQNKQ